MRGGRRPCKRETTFGLGKNMDLPCKGEDHSTACSHYAENSKDQTDNRKP